MHRNFLSMSSFNIYCRSLSTKFKQGQIIVLFCDRLQPIWNFLVCLQSFFPFTLTTPAVQISPPSNIFLVSDQSSSLLFSGLFQLVHFSEIQETVWGFIVGSSCDRVHWKNNSILLFRHQVFCFNWEPDIWFLVLSIDFSQVLKVIALNTLVPFILKISKCHIKDADVFLTSVIHEEPAVWWLEMFPAEVITLTTSLYGMN